MTKPAPPARRSTESFDASARLSSVPAATAKKVPRVRHIDEIAKRAQLLHDVVAALREKLDHLVRVPFAPFAIAKMIPMRGCADDDDDNGQSPLAKVVMTDRHKTLN